MRVRNNYFFGMNYPFNTFYTTASSGPIDIQTNSTLAHVMLLK